MIEINNLNITIKKKTILKDINIKIQNGEKIAFLGASGSGKSMIMQSILGVIPQNMNLKGTINTNERFGVILQNPSSCFDNLYTIREHFLETIKAHGIKTIDFHLKEFDLEESVLDMYPFMLSGGTLQKIMIAICFSINPSFILADEMTSNLDSVTIKNLIKLILEKQQKDKFGILFITHDISLAKNMADRIIVIDNGQVVEDSTKEELLNSPKSDIAKILLKENKKLNNTMWHNKSSNNDNTTNHIIKINDIRKTYKSNNLAMLDIKNNILKNIDINLLYRRNLGILGKNGSGKSTLAKILLGLERYDSGNIEILGKNIKLYFDKQLRKNIQAIFQDSSYLNPNLSAIDTILEGIENFQKLSNKNEIAKKLAEIVQLNTDYLYKKNVEFSGGEQQRIALARILALEPKIIILDEAISNLDAHLQYKMIEVFKNIEQNTDTTFIVISHDIRIILQLCKDIVILDNGEIVYHTTIENGLQNAISNKYFIEFFNLDI